MDTADRLLSAAPLALAPVPHGLKMKKPKKKKKRKRGDGGGDEGTKKQQRPPIIEAEVNLQRMKADRKRKAMLHKALSARVEKVNGKMMALVLDLDEGAGYYVVEVQSDTQHTYDVLITFDGQKVMCPCKDAGRVGQAYNACIDCKHAVFAKMWRAKKTFLPNADGKFTAAK